MRASGSGAATPRFLATCILVSSLLFVAVPAQADVGTPLIWASFLHLSIGNAIIGLIEGFILSKGCEASRKRCVVSIVIANYASMVVGILSVRYFDIFLPGYLGT